MTRRFVLAAVLFAASVPAQAPVGDARFDLAAIEREFAVAHGTWLKALRGGEESAESPSKVFVDRCLLAAERQRGTPAAVPFLAWIVRHATGERAAVEKALQVLVRDHLADPGWAPVLDVLPATRDLVGPELLLTTVDRVLAAEPASAIRVRALAARAALRSATAPDGAAGDEARAAARVDLAAAREACQETALRAELAWLHTDLSGEPRGFVEDDHGLAERVAMRAGKPLLVDLLGFNCGTCRLIELTMLSRREFASLLGNFVESRLHVDAKGDLTAERFAENLAQQQLLTDSKAIPRFVIVDPRTGRALRSFVLQGGPSGWEDQFAAQLRGESAEAGGDGVRRR